MTPSKMETPRNSEPIITEQSGLFASLIKQFSTAVKDKAKSKKLETLERMEEQRRSTWAAIAKNHELLLQLNPPESYLTTYKKNEKRNDVFMRLLTVMADVIEVKLVVLDNSGLEYDPKKFVETTDDYQQNSMEIEEAMGATGYVNLDTPIHRDVEEQSGKQLMVFSPDPTQQTGIPRKKLQELGAIPKNYGEIHSSSKNVAPSMARNMQQNHSQQGSNYGNTEKDSIRQQATRKLDSKNISLLEACENEENFYGEAHQAQDIMNNIGQTTKTANGQANLSLATAMTSLVELINKNLEKNVQVNSNNRIKLERLEVPTFDGNILEYKSFKELFLKSVARTSWSELESLLFLRNKLKKSAYERIAHLQLESENYQEAWNTLDKEFLVERALCQHNLNKLLNMSTAKLNDVKSMRQHYTVLNTVARNLSQLTLDPKCWLMELAYMYLEERLKRRYEDFIRAKDLEASIKTLTDFLMLESNLAEQAEEKKNYGLNQIQKTHFEGKSHNNGHNNGYKMSSRVHVTANPEGKIKKTF